VIVPHWSAWLFQVAMLALAIGSALSAISFHEMSRLLGQAVEKALIDFDDMPVKEAAAIMGVDYSQFCKALRGEGYRLIALNHLVKLGPRFMAHLTRHLMWLTTEYRVAEFKQEVAEFTELARERKRA
jgi:hypothetical protein